VPGETVWKIAEGVVDSIRWWLKTAKLGFFTPFCPFVEPLTRGYADFPNSFSEVHSRKSISTIVHSPTRIGTEKAPARAVVATVRPEANAVPEPLAMYSSSLASVSPAKRMRAVP
jgi:hypothetical protein